MFQAADFKSAKSKIIRNGQEFYPVRYLHAEFDINEGTFRHFDGSIHFYTDRDYYERRDSDFNYIHKNNPQHKAHSHKLFKVNGQLEVEDWIELASQFLTGNPLIFEYFEGKLPDRIIDIVESIYAYRQKNHNR